MQIAVPPVLSIELPELTQILILLFHPGLEKKTKYIANDEMITGTGYLAQPDSMKLLGEVFKVKGTLYKTGTMDSALYVDIEKVGSWGRKIPKRNI